MENVLIVNIGDRYESCDVKIKKIHRRGFFVKATTLGNDEIVLKNLDGVIDLATMYIKDTKSVYIPIDNSVLGNYVVFYDNDAKNTHDGLSIGWGGRMVESFGRIGILMHHSVPECFRVNFGYDSWSIHKSCLKGINMDLFLKK